MKILDVKDFNNLRVVAFLSDNSPGFVQFSKNKVENVFITYDGSHFQQDFLGEAQND
ncbi:hypothetical protein [Alkalihalobacillus sp. AL-G]|uniref:hypothetical protein n=1 Tax=Alkalihalobacillus sp. AL-G TaxID=2926399 RepID=UPI00272DA77B|nr:hypothetical protein [Alkalihalobacillus sp. AL-G]WLD92303.1 hypothetical protein MOJ78_14945 [Alkalihalobacillus sp. AL-G]